MTARTATASPLPRRGVIAMCLGVAAVAVVGTLIVAVSGPAWDVGTGIGTLASAVAIAVTDHRSRAMSVAAPASIDASVLLVVPTMLALPPAAAALAVASGTLVGCAPLATGKFWYRPTYTAAVHLLTVAALSALGHLVISSVAGQAGLAALAVTVVTAGLLAVGFELATYTATRFAVLRETGQWQASIPWALNSRLYVIAAFTAPLAVELTRQNSAYVLACFGVVFAIVMTLEQYQRTRLELDETARSDQQSREQLLRAVVRAADDERTHLTALLHDGPLQGLLAARLSAELAAGDIPVALQRLETAGPDAVARELRDAWSNQVEVLHQATEELRTVMRASGAPVRGEVHLLDSLRHHAASLRSGARFDLSVSLHDPTAIPDVTVLAFFSALRELMTYAGRHAGATEVHVRVSSTAEAVTGRLVQNGTATAYVPGTPPTAQTMPIALAEERARTAGGRLEVELAGQEHRTCFVVRIPYEPRRTAAPAPHAPTQTGVQSGSDEPAPAPTDPRARTGR